MLEIQPSVEGAPAKFKFKEMGPKAASLFDKDPTGEYYSSGAKVIPAARIMRKLNEIFGHNAPLYDEGQFVTQKNKVVKFRSCIVPFGRDGRVTHAVVGLSWREF